MAGRAEQRGGRDEAWCSAAVTGGEGVNLGPADCDGGSEYRSCCCTEKVASVAQEAKPNAGKTVIGQR